LAAEESSGRRGTTKFAEEKRPAHQDPLVDAIDEMNAGAAERERMG
jgi:hypothetical protein